MVHVKCRYVSHVLLKTASNDALQVVYMHSRVTIILLESVTKSSCVVCHHHIAKVHVALHYNDLILLVQ